MSRNPPTETPEEHATLQSAGWNRIYRGIVEQDTLDLVLRLTVLLQIPFPKAVWYEQAVLLAAAVSALVYRPLMRSPWFWLSLGGFRLLASVLFEWSIAYNSDYVIAYWSIALGCALFLPDPRAAVAWSAKVMIGLVFLFATAWKLTSPEYLDGSTFHSLIYSDVRFLTMTRYALGDVSDSVLRDFERTRTGTRMLEPVIALRHDPALFRVAQILTWWTVLIEGVIAVLFLWKDGPRIVHARNILLLIFIVTTYPPTGLIVFAWAISIMGLAQCPPAYSRTRLCYLLTMLGSTLFWTGGLERVLSGLFGT